MLSLLSPYEDLKYSSRKRNLGGEEDKKWGDMIKGISISKYINKQVQRANMQYEE